MVVRNGITYTRAQLFARAVRTTGTVTMAAFEAFVLAEILWYYLHDGTQTLHGAIADYAQDIRRRTAFTNEVRDTLRAIRNLPEE